MSQPCFCGSVLHCVFVLCFLSGVGLLLPPRPRGGPNLILLASWAGCCWCRWARRLWSDSATDCSVFFLVNKLFPALTTTSCFRGTLTISKTKKVTYHAAKWNLTNPLFSAVASVRTQRSWFKKREPRNAERLRRCALLKIMILWRVLSCEKHKGKGKCSFIGIDQ